MAKKYDTKMPTRTCPICGETYDTVPAVSRTDNVTLICPDCGIRQNLAMTFGLDTKTQEHILSLIHQYEGC